MSLDKSGLFLDYWRMIYPNEPAPIPEYKFAANMGRKYRADWAWPEYHIAVEIDGGRWMPHGGRHASESDIEKRNHYALLGWLVFYFTPQMLKSNPAGCLEMVKQRIDFSR